jgi:hypothetical protein
MKILVTGGTGKLATELKKYIKADFLSKEQLNLTSKERISQLPNYDILIHAASGSIDISLNLNLLISTIKPKKIFAFTSRQGTYLNWKENSNIEYGLEKIILNFIIYRNNITKNNGQLIEPGHMETTEQYNNIAKKFSIFYKDCDFKKNMIFDIVNNRFIPY